MKPVLKIIQPGPHTSVQDEGRFGYQDNGIPISGALDRESFNLANFLVGNPLGVAALEVRFEGPTLEIGTHSVRVALTGTREPLEIMGESVRRMIPWHSIILRNGQRFRVPRLHDTSTAYLAVEGGFDLPSVLDSCSTFLRGGFGGFRGRLLKAGDRLPLCLDRASDRPGLGLGTPPNLDPPKAIRVVPGPQDDLFTRAAVETFLSAEYAVSHHSDRMGMRLDGPVLPQRDGIDVVSDGIATGAVQIPGSGHPIILLADHQTTGGYPKIATVISTDLPAMGRMNTTDRLRFTAISADEAERIRRQREKHLRRLIGGAKSFLDTIGLDVDALHGRNLISGVVGPVE